jgi:hypothetical protein
MSTAPLLEEVAAQFAEVRSEDCCRVGCTVELDTVGMSNSVHSGDVEIYRLLY